MTLPALAPEIDEATQIGDGGELLTLAVRAATGIPDAKPREGQARLHKAIVGAMSRRHGHVVGAAPTGSGKSFAALSAAYLASIQHGDRTVISTDSLALMAQLQDKDVPVVDRVATEHFSANVAVAFLKGTSNYVDPAKTISAAQNLTGLNTLRFAVLADALEKGDRLHNLDQFPGVDENDSETLRQLVLWACRVYADSDPDEPGDRHSCPIECTPALWETVSSSSSESDDGSRYGVEAKVVTARELAATADIVVTNHSILAVQAALGVPVIIGSLKLGEFHHIIVDEAHTLPGHVRSQGAAKLSGGTISRVGRSVAKACDNSSSAQRWRNVGDTLGEELEVKLRLFAEGSQGGVRRVKEGDHAIAGLDSALLDWVKAGKKLLANKESSTDVTTRLRAATAKDALDTLKQTVDAVTRHRSGWARWVEKDEFGAAATHREWWAAHVSPIDVGFMLRDNLWSYNIMDGDFVEKVRLSVSAISATMPSNFGFQAGLDAELVSYPSPFADAYKRSALYIPSISGADAKELSVPGYGGKARFDVKKHAEWAAQQIVELVRETGGRALILSATARDGKIYAATLRSALPDVKVHSQWDGGSATKIVGEWRDDVGSVLVGTRTMMTGVDAPGETCSMVVVDRVPRSPSNPLDEARVEQLNERLGNVWEAQRQVYSVDAALLLQQAAGRLIRSGSDTGIVVVLDPRMLKSTPHLPSPFAYPEQTRQTYMGAVRDFGQKIVTLEDAKKFIQRSL